MLGMTAVAAFAAAARAAVATTVLAFGVKKGGAQHLTIVAPTDIMGCTIEAPSTNMGCAKIEQTLSMPENRNGLRNH